MSRALLFTDAIASATGGRIADAPLDAPAITTAMSYVGDAMNDQASTIRWS